MSCIPFLIIHMSVVFSTNNLKILILFFNFCIKNTEDISDEVFLKRHQKFEISEKRRKKWDYQRIREQKTVER